MKIGLLAAWIFLLFFLTGCTGRSPMPTSMPTYPPSTHSPKPTTAPSLAPTPTQLSTPIVTPQPTSPVVQRCLTLQPGLPTGNAYPGIIAFDNHLPGVKDSLSFYDLQKSTWRAVPGRENMDLAVSPDRKYYAYLVSGPNQIQIFTSDGKPVKSIAEGKYWYKANWLDNSHFVIPLLEPDPKFPDNLNALKTPQSTVLLDWITGQVQTLLPDYPDIANEQKYTIYHPDLKRVIYKGSNSSDAGTILYSLPEKKKLVELPSVHGGHYPVWSPDGSQFLVMGDDGFYLVQYDGKVSKINHLDPIYDSASGIFLHYDSHYYSWSPDGRQVALWLEVYTSKITLAILDTRTGKVTDTCIPRSRDASETWQPLPYPVWGPDGKSLVVAANYHVEDPEKNDVILVDLDKQTAYKVTTDNFPVGWLVSP
jgi:WD40 repeat protein